MQPVQTSAKKRLWSKLPKNAQLLLIKVPKMTKTINFLIKQKMCGICNFHNKFSILGPSDMFEWVPDMLVPHGPIFEPRTLIVQLFRNFLFLRAFLWIFALPAVT